MGQGTRDHQGSLVPGIRHLLPGGTPASFQPGDLPPRRARPHCCRGSTDEARMDLGEERAARPGLLSTHGAWVAALNLPAVLLIVGLIGYPVFLSFWISLHYHNLRRPGEIRFAGFSNYGQILTSTEFYGTLGLTLSFALVAVAAVVLVGL